ncbi:MAG TPA: Fe2+-dependent dioxygenase [Steroidobacteraceae bacterium]|nr:Fe2+-dependent dioxygenase [Steroidobacteraceae bacterium]
MIVRVPAVLDAAQLAAVQARLHGAAWEDGRATAGHQSAQVKHNLQLPQEAPEARAAAGTVVRALECNALFISAALPRHVYPPLFNRYEAGMRFGEHVDNAVRQIPGTHHRLRIDVSATLFLSACADYDGGELLIEDTFGTHNVKLEAGDMVVYPASSRHSVAPVTRGARLAAFFWVQSMVRDDADRSLLFELDSSIRQLSGAGAAREPLLQLTACYHNLLRRWALL